MRIFIYITCVLLLGLLLTSTVYASRVGEVRIYPLYEIVPGHSMYDILNRII